MSSRRSPLLLVAFLLLTACAGLRSPEPQGPLTGDALVEALREGGLVLYLRHTESTAEGVDDVSTPGECAAERKLTGAGRQDAREIGVALEKLRVPVGRVLVSPFCRTVDTARLAFGRVEIERALLTLPSSPEKRALDAARALLAAVPREGTNSVLVGHITNVRPVTGLEPKEGGTLIFRPDGKGGFRLVAEVAPGGWRRLAARR